MAAKKNELRGHHTTEFWMTLIFHAAGITLTALGEVQAQWAVGASAIAQGAYNFSRGLATKEPPKPASR